MSSLLIALSIPLFFLGIGLEWWLARRRGLALYRFEDSITNLSCGIGQQVTGLFLTALTLVGYHELFTHHRVFTVPFAWWAWPLCLVGVDLGYYWFHRASHRINAIWAGHVVHHQSEEYNLAVALRQSWFVKLLEWPFYLPLALLGFPPEMFVTAFTLDVLYQFWIHTRLVGKLGPLELVMNTPSHHRVHHGIDPKYIDKNYAGVFIVWDRMFGTFQEEEEEPAYGLVKPLASWSPLWANAHRWVEIAELSAAATTIGEKLYAFVAPPEWRPAALGGPLFAPPVDHASRVKYDARGLGTTRAYVVANFVVVALATGALLVLAPRAPRPVVAVAVALVLLSLVSWAALFERRRWAWPLEISRLAGVALVVAWAAILR